MADSFFFFFQAEDGIRDLTVTGVQTCALPICGRNDVAKAEGPIAEHQAHGVGMPPTPVSCRGHAFVLPNIISRTESSDRKSTRLNSSHSQISYAVFCLKKKKKKKEASQTEQSSL